MRQLFLVLFIGLLFSTACRTKNTEFVTVALPEKFSTLDTLTTTASDAAAERVRSLMFNSLVRKNEKFEYVGELAQEIKPSEDGKIITFVLRDGVKFHNGKDFTSADVKYTFDELFKSNSYKSGAFFDTVDGQKDPHIVSLETPDPKTVVVTLSRPSLQNQLLSNFVAIPIIPEGTVAQQSTSPVGTGPFKFVNFDQSQNIVELAAHTDYWEGAPKVNKIRVKTVPDANSLQAELQSGGVDIAPLPSNLSPDTLKSLGQNPNLKVEQFEGSNIDYLGFNTQSAPLDKVKIRQAIAYGVDREKIINELLFGQAVIAHSILPEESWAYNAGTKYSYNPERAKQLLQEAGYKNEPIKFKFGAGNAAVSQYAQVIQNSLRDIGLNVEIETLEGNVMRQQLALGQFQMNTGRWIGGNQDPIFLKDLFSTGAIPGDKIKCCNRSRYSNSEFDEIIQAAINTTDREKARELYFKAQEIVSNDVPLFPLWYPANMVVANKRIGNIKIGASGDWSFIKDLTIDSK
ncbi:MAG: ABC transporter substrate-binding protein [Acidobacteria bacterium]|nr:ABC transporter substrate-binding protein [Acidobacteriota bacterium]